MYYMIDCRFFMNFKATIGNFKVINDSNTFVGFFMNFFNFSF